MKKLICLIMISALLLAGCDDPISSTPGDVVSGNGGTSSSTPVIEQSSTAPSSVDPVSSSQSASSATNSSSTAPAESTGPNYSAYSSLIYAYEKATKPYSHIEGTLYANLVDFNGDDVFELVIARVYDDDDTQIIDLISEDDNENLFNTNVQIFSLDDNGGVKHDGKMPLSYWGGADSSSFTLGYLVKDDVTYLVHSMVDPMGVYGVLHKSYWQYITEGSDTFFGDKHTMNIVRSQSVGATDVYMLDDEEVSESEFTEWWEPTYSHVVVSESGEFDADEITAQTKEFLADYPRANSVGTSAVFEDGYFVIVEGTPENTKQQLVIDYHIALLQDNHDEMANVFGTTKVVDDIFEMKSPIPGTIIENFEMLATEDILATSIALKQLINESIDLAYLVDPILVQSDIQSVIDMDVVQYTGQYGQSSREWYVIDRHADDNEYMELVVTDNHFMGLPDNAFSVEFVGYYQEVLNTQGDDIPMFDTILFDSEQESIERFETDYGNEFYLIRSRFDTPIQVYQTFINNNGDYERGQLLYETESNMLYILCNISDLYSEVEIVTSWQGHGEYSYYPGINLMDGSIALGDYAEEFRTLGE